MQLLVWGLHNRLLHLSLESLVQLRENVSYRPVQSIELKTNLAYGYMQHDM